MAITKSIRKEVGMKFQGNPGEELVSYLSSKSGILATPPKQDQFGWDLHFQFSSNLTPIFMDEHESNYNAYVQVKEFTQDYDNYKGRDIKLSNIQHMISYCYTCEVNKELGESNLEHYETNNGMKAKWVNIHEAIEHNKLTMATSEKMGMSIERETFLLSLIAERIL